jgi:hypothetical protein
MPKDLPREERIAVGLPIQRMSQGDPALVHRVSCLGLQQSHNLVVAEPGQIDALDMPLAPQRCEQISERAFRGQIGLAIGSDDQEPALVTRRE